MLIDHHADFYQCTFKWYTYPGGHMSITTENISCFMQIGDTYASLAWLIRD